MTTEHTTNEILGMISPALARFAQDQGWEDLTPAQKAFIPAATGSDDNLIIMAPTGGGKLYAVLFAVLTKAGERLMVWYIAPTKALLNDIFERTKLPCDEDYCDFRVALFHGDAPQSGKSSFLADPNGIIDITPESIESMFTNKPEVLYNLVGNAGDGVSEYVVVDEIHAFFGTERGTHLQSLLHRMALIRGERIPFYGMSATIGGGVGSLALLKGFTGDPEHTFVIKMSDEREYDIEVDYFPDDEGVDEQQDLTEPIPDELDLDAEDCIEGSEETTAEPDPDKACLKTGKEKMYDALVSKTEGCNAILFSNSRGDVEETAVELNARMGETGRTAYTHTSCTPKKGREEIEEMLEDDAEVTVCATSTLQEGVDKETNLICQIGAPFSAFSLAQRVGRSGRHGGTPSLYLCCTDPWDLLKGIAACTLVLRGEYEAPDLKVERWNIVLHQMLSVVAEHTEATIEKISEALVGSPAFPYCTEDDVAAIAEYEVETGVLGYNGDALYIETEGERYVGKMDSYIVCNTPGRRSVLADGKVIGWVPSEAMLGIGSTLYLNGRVWQVAAVEKNKVHVCPAASGKKPTFFGEAPMAGKELEQEMKRILLSDEAYPFLSESCNAPLAELREAFTSMESLGSSKSPFEMKQKNLLTIYPFMGTKVFNTLRLLFGAQADGYGLTMCITLEEFLQKCREFVANPPDLVALEHAMIEKGETRTTAKLEDRLPLLYQARQEATSALDHDETLAFLLDLCGYEMPEEPLEEQDLAEGEVMEETPGNDPGHNSD